MEPIYSKQFTIGDTQVNSFDRLKNSQVLALLQEAAGEHSAMLGVDKEYLQERELMWALIRYRIEILRLPRAGETVTVQTWPMPTTRTAYPRATVVYDGQGEVLFRGVSLWVLMSASTRAMVLPAKSGVVVNGCVRGEELSLPGSLLPKELGKREFRLARFSDLDINGHVNNCRYMEWVDDLLDADFHSAHYPKEMVICYLSETREGENVEISWSLEAEQTLCVEIRREEEKMSIGHSRVFAAQIRY